MTIELEQRLTQLFNDRAGTITAAPAYELTESVRRNPRIEHLDRRAGGPRRTIWYLSAAAVAAITVAVTSIVVASRSGQPAAGNRAGCALARSATFASAVRRGALPPGDQLMALAPDGSQLVNHVQDGTTTSVDVISPRGTTHRLWTAAAGQRVRAIANPFGAVSAAMATFLLQAPGTRTATVMVAPLGGRATRLGGADRGYGLVTSADLAPVVIDASVAALEAPSGHPAAQKLLVFMMMNAVQWSRTPGQPYTAVTQLLPVGGNLVLASSGPHGNVGLKVPDPGLLPVGLGVAARSGYGFATDRSTLTWFTDDPTGTSLWRWAPGAPVPTRHRVPAGIVPELSAGALVAAHRSSAPSDRLVVSVAKRAPVQLPSGMRVVGLTARFAAVSYPTPQGLGYSRIAVGAFENCR